MPGGDLMSAMQWTLGFVAVVVYFACLFWLGIRSFERGYLVLGILGIFLPLFWVLGALLPDKRALRAGPA
jgi:hypothetical protein